MKAYERTPALRNEEAVILSPKRDKGDSMKLRTVLAFLAAVSRSPNRLHMLEMPSGRVAFEHNIPDDAHSYH